MKMAEELLRPETQHTIDQYCPDPNAVLLDIETTGLSRRMSHLYMIGVIFHAPAGWTLRQWLPEKPAEEKEALELFSAFLSALPAAPTLVHFNGASFDLPYLRYRYAFYEMEDPMDGLCGMDLFRILRPYRKLLGLSSFRQKDLEAAMGIGREDTMSGGELIPVYQEYLRTGQPELLQMLFLHNHDDLVHLADLLSLLSLPALFADGLFTAESPVLMNHPSDPGCRRSENQSSDAAGITMPAGQTASSGDAPQLRMVLRLSLPLPFRISLQNEMCVLNTCECGTGEDGSLLELFVRGEKGVKKLFFDHYRDYYYLPAEDMAIHKSVAAFTDAAHRRQATRATCYQPREGLFFPCGNVSGRPVFRDTAESQTAWILYDARFFGDAAAMHDYAAGILQSLPVTLPS